MGPDTRALSLDLPPEDRAAFLKAECTDTAIRAEVKTLLGQADNSSNLLDPPALEGMREVIEAAISDGVPGPDGGGTGSTESVSGVQGAVIGRYRLLEKIGAGGMGEVWRAEQTEPIRRQVAFKLVKAGSNASPPGPALRDWHAPALHGRAVDATNSRFHGRQ
jgi:hypothetical protein